MPTDEFQRLCLDTLAAGAVQSFVDLCYLACDEKSSDAFSLDKARELLVKAELARRHGDTATVIRHYEALAELHMTDKNMKTAVYFLERCLDIAKMVSDNGAQMRILAQLGTAYDELKDSDRAVSFHDAHRALAASMGNAEELSSAASQLVRVRTDQAAQCERKGDAEQALSYYLAAAEVAESCDNCVMQATSSYNAGRTYVLLKHAEEAIPYLQQHLRTVLSHEELEGRELQAYGALAAAYLSCGNLESASECLHDVISDAAEEVSLEVAEAIEHLGIIHARQGDLPKALDFFTEALDLQTQLLDAGLTTRERVDKLRLVIGSVSASAIFADHTSLVLQPDITALLSWKKMHAGS